MSRRPTGCRARSSGGSRSKTVLRPFSSERVVTTAAGLLRSMVVQGSREMGRPSTEKRSVSGVTRNCGSVTTRPFTFSRPVSAQSRVWLREAAPSFDSARSSGTFPLFLSILQLYEMAGAGASRSA